MAFCINGRVIILFGFFVGTLFNFVGTYLIDLPKSYEGIQPLFCEINGTRNRDCAIEMKIRGCNRVENNQVCHLRFNSTIDISVELISRNTLREPMVEIELMDRANQLVTKSNFPLCESSGCTIFAHETANFELLSVIPTHNSAASKIPDFSEVYRHLNAVQYSLINRMNGNQRCCIKFYAHVDDC